MLSPEEVERYARHIVLREIGGPGQQRLKTARVLVIGAGGLGSPLIQYLAAAGLGEIGIIDDDRVALSNLQRQTLFATCDIGRPKALVAREAILRLNPHVRVSAHEERIDESNAARLIAGYDAVADGSDNFATRYSVSDACYFAKVPLVTAAVGSFDASITTLRPFERGANGNPNPTYRCLFPEPPAPGAIPTCAEAGIVGALTGLVGSIMALEMVRTIVNFGESLVGRLLMIDALNFRFEVVTYAWDPDNPLNGGRLETSGRNE